MTYTEGILEAGRVIMSHSDKLDIIRMAVANKSTRSIMTANYHECLNAGLSRIETLSESQRKELWVKANEIGKGMEVKELIDLCRCIYWYENMKS